MCKEKKINDFVQQFLLFCVSLRCKRLNHRCHMDFSDVLNFLGLEHVSCVAVYAGSESFRFLMRAGCWLSKKWYVRSQTPITSQCAEARILTARSWLNFCSHLKLKLLDCRRKKKLFPFLSCRSLQHSQSQYRSIHAKHYKILTMQFTFHLRYSLHLWFVANSLCFFFCLPIKDIQRKF